MPEERRQPYTLTIAALKSGQDLELIKAMPKDVQGCLLQPLICELIVPAAAGERLLKKFIEAQLIRLAALVNAAHNFTSPQIVLTAQALIDNYPKESLADIVLVLERLARGYYGPDYHKLDCSTVCAAMVKHLEEKADYLQLQHDTAKKEELHMADAFQKNFEEARVRMYSETEKLRQLREDRIQSDKREKILKEDELLRLRQEYAKQPPMTPEKYLLRQLISKATSAKYAGREDFTGFSNHDQQGYQVFAASPEDAAEIFHQATREVLEMAKQTDNQNPV